MRKHRVFPVGVLEHKASMGKWVSESRRIRFPAAPQILSSNDKRSANFRDGMCFRVKQTEFCRLSLYLS